MKLSPKAQETLRKVEQAMAKIESLRSDLQRVRPPEKTSEEWFQLIKQELGGRARVRRSTIEKWMADESTDVEEMVKQHIEKYK